MAINLDGLAGAVGNAENQASAAVNGLNANSSVADLTKASMAMNKFQLVATAVAQIIKAEGEAKQSPARSISS